MTRGQVPHGLQTPLAATVPDGLISSLFVLGFHFPFPELESSLSLRVSRYCLTITRTGEETLSFCQLLRNRGSAGTTRII
jgi:hypothetical protein